MEQYQDLPRCLQIFIPIALLSVNFSPLQSPISCLLGSPNLKSHINYGLRTTLDFPTREYIYSPTSYSSPKYINNSSTLIQ